MRNLIIRGLTCAAVALVLDGAVSAHGGQYRGPTDIVPPGARGGGGPSPGAAGPGGPTTGRPAGPSVPQPGQPWGGGGPATGGRGPGGGVAGPGTGTGVLVDDLTQWQFWWEFNKDPFIRLKDSIHAAGPVTDSDMWYMGSGATHRGTDTLRPTERQIRRDILPALRRALDDTEQRDITSSCMVAMAKIGLDHDEFAILPLFRQRLRSHDQEVRETAALAMGISQMPAAVEDLAALLKDSPAGRRLVGRSEVDDRTRAFAAYGLGLIAHAYQSADLKARVFDALAEVLLDESTPSRNVKVAVVHAIGLCHPDLADEKGRKLADACLDALEDYYRRDLGRSMEFIQAHVPPAIAKLCDSDAGRSSDRAQRFRKQMIDDLLAERGQRSAAVVQSAAIALGRLATADGDGDAAASAALWRYYREGRDQQARYFALIALGQIGGAENRTALLSALARGKKALEKPWAALALGVMCHDGAQDGEIDRTVGEQLHREFRATQNPSTRAALAIALGLCRYQPAADDLERTLQSHRHQDELAGYLCIGLALMGSTRSIATIEDIVRRAVRRPDLLRQAAMALGKLGDHDAAAILAQMLTTGDQNLARMSSVASALGFIGDLRSVPPLIDALGDRTLTDLSRAFAAVALGGIADKEPLPWNSKIAANTNYRAAVETLTNRVSGILDIL